MINTDGIANPRVYVVTKPREFVTWDNLETGRDREECYERLDISGSIVFVNAYNRNSTVTKGSEFWNFLEALYQGLKNDNK